MAKKEMAIYTRPAMVGNNKFVFRKPELIEVRVMSRAEGWAMVRRKGCMPFCVSEGHLSPLYGEGDTKGDA